MNVVVIIFMIVATIFALASLGYVAIDLVLELRSKEEKKEERKDKKDNRRGEVEVIYW